MPAREPIDVDEEGIGLFEQAFAFEEGGEHDQALELRGRLLDCYPDNERVIIAFARSLAAVGSTEEAERQYRKAIFIFPYSELSSLQLFHFLWDANRTDDAFVEMKRFQSISHSDDYDKFVHTINREAGSD